MRQTQIMLAWQKTKISITKFSTLRFTIIGALVALIFTLQLSHILSDAPIKNDAKQNTISAFNLYKHGVFSRRKSSNPDPTMRREPLPPALLAVYFFLNPKFDDNWDLGSLLNGEGVQLVKASNLVWGFLLFLGVWLGLQLLTSSYWASIIGVAATYQYFASAPNIIDRLYTELHASVLLVMLILLVIKWLRSDLSFNWLITIGVISGLLALTKAVFLYVGLFYLVIVAAYLINKSSDKWKASKCVALMFLVFFTMTIPWMARNYHQFDKFTIADRGRSVIFVRAYKNQMTPLEMKGALYYYGPKPARGFWEKLFGFDPVDLKKGGRLERLNRRVSYSTDIPAFKQGRPENAVSYVYQATAIQTRQRNLYREGKTNVTTDEFLSKEIKKRIIEAPGKHIAMSFIFAYRGMWWNNLQRKSEVLANVLFYAMFWLFGLYTLFRRRWESFLLVAPSLGVLAIYAVASHNLQRYSAPTIPVVIMIGLSIIYSTNWLRIWNYIKGINK